MADRTVFIIAHRLSTVRNADKIVVVNYGKIAEIGTHEELIDKPNGIYACLLYTSKKFYTTSCITRDTTPQIDGMIYFRKSLKAFLLACGNRFFLIFSR